MYIVKLAFMLIYISFNIFPVIYCIAQPIIPESSNYNKNIQWRTFEGVSQSEKANKIIADAEGNVVVISCPPNPYLAKLNGETGDLIWENHMNSISGMLLGLTEIKNGNRIDYIISGGIGSTRERWVARLNGNTGSIIWQKSYPYAGSEEQFDTVRNVTIGSDKFIYGSGHVQADEKDSFFVVYGGNAFTMKIDPSDGREVWTSLNAYAEFAVAHQEHSNGYLYYVADSYDEDLSLVKIDKSNGAIASTTILSSTEQIIPSDLAIGSDDYLYLGGHAGRSGPGDPFDYTSTKIAEDGSVTWTKRYANPRGYSLEYIRNELYGIKIGVDGIYLFGASGDENPDYSKENSLYPSSDEWVGWILKTDFEGSVLRSDIIYHDEGEGGNTATEYGDLIPDGYVICNDTDANWSSGGADIGVMKIVIDNESKPEVPPILWYTNASELEGGWHWNEWLGYFNTNADPWIYHLEHNWLYFFPSGSGTESIYFWDDVMKSVLWTSETTYPFLYCFSYGGWLWYLKDSKNPRRFFNFLNNKWEER